jgi:tetratricopeptide (TPR) repeat protein
MKLSILLLGCTWAALSLASHGQGLGQRVQRDNMNPSNGWEHANAEAMKIEAAMPLVKRGIAAMDKRDYSRAEKLLTQANQIAEHNAEAMLPLAECYEHERKYDAAMGVYHALVYSVNWGGSINSNPNTSFRYMLLLVHANRLKEANEVFAKANRSLTITNGHPIFSAVEPGTTDPIALEAAAHLGLGTTAQSHAPTNRADQLLHLKEAVTLKPNWGDAQYYYGEALQRAGHRAQALIAFKRAAASGDENIRTKAQASLAKLR